MDHFIVFLVTANPDIILATINPDFLALTVREFFMGIPKNLISTMSAFVVSIFFGVVGDFLWHKFTPTPNYLVLSVIRFFNCANALLRNFKFASLFLASLSDLYAS
jgi:hypothetical protein